MSSTDADIPSSVAAESVVVHENKEKADVPEDEYNDTLSLRSHYDSTHRQLRPRHIQLIGIGGTIGTALYVSIGRGLINGGPGSLFIAFSIW